MKTDDQPKDNFAARIFGRIKSEHLVPRPRWEFVFKNYFFWTLGALAVAFGALAFSATLFRIENVDWRLSVATHSSFFSFFIDAAPFVWVLTLILFVLIGYVNVRRTEHGYRYSLAVIAIGAILTSITLGSGLYAIGFGSRVDEIIGDHPPFYRPILVTERSWWLAPEKGLLGGQVVEDASDISSFMLRDFSGRVWEIDASDLRAPDLAVIARGGMVRVVGLPIEVAMSSATSSVFHACFVFPWETHGDFRNNPPPPPLATIASTSGENAASSSNPCKNIRPYRQLRSVDDIGF
jgi:hypothetical protein